MKSNFKHVITTEEAAEWEQKMETPENAVVNVMNNGEYLFDIEVLPSIDMTSATTCIESIVDTVFADSVPGSRLNDMYMPEKVDVSTNAMILLLYTNIESMDADFILRLAYDFDLMQLVRECINQRHLAWLLGAIQARVEHRRQCLVSDSSAEIAKLIGETQNMLSQFSSIGLTEDNKESFLADLSAEVIRTAEITERLKP